jgi:hypothetical protein
MKLAYCVECNPRRVIAAGPMGGTPFHRVAEGVYHRGVKVIDVPDDRPKRKADGETETPQEFLDRLAAMHHGGMV